MFEHYDPVSLPTQEELLRLVVQSSWGKGDIAAYVLHSRERLACHTAWLSRKPVADLRAYEKEEAFLGLYEPITLEFNYQPPTGISFADHLDVLVMKIREVQHRVWKHSIDPPKCVISGPGVAEMLEAAFSFTERPKRGLFGDIEVHKELGECIPPYFIPQGELHLYYGWRYRLPGEQDVRWPEPVGIIQIDELIEPAMVTLARAAR